MSGRRLRRKFSWQFKAEVVAQMVRGASVAELSAKHSIKPGVLYRWRNEAAQMLESAQAMCEAVNRKHQKLEREVHGLRKQRAVFNQAFGGAGPQNATK